MTIERLRKMKEEGIRLKGKRRFLSGSHRDVRACFLTIRIKIEENTIFL